MPRQIFNCRRSKVHNRDRWRSLRGRHAVHSHAPVGMLLGGALKHLSVLLVLHNHLDVFFKENITEFLECDLLTAHTTRVVEASSEVCKLETYFRVSARGSARRSYCVKPVVVVVHQQLDASGCDGGENRDNNHRLGSSE